MIWVWNGVINRKENPLARIRREIVAYTLKKDLEAAKKIDCIYTSLCLIGKKYGKKYRFNNFFVKFGNFKNTELRRFFLFSFFDTCAYSRICPKCQSLSKDILKHCLTDCAKTKKLRMILRIKLLFLKANKLVSTEKLSCKTTLYSLAMLGNSFRDALCDFLGKVGYYSNVNGKLNH